MNRRKSDRLPIFPLDGPVSHRSHERSPPSEAAQPASRGETYVPISQEARYFFCSGVSRSIRIPEAASFRRAISRSIGSGTA